MNPKADLPGGKLQVQKELVKKKKVESTRGRHRTSRPPPHRQTCAHRSNLSCIHTSLSVSTPPPTGITPACFYTPSVAPTIACGLRC